MGNYTFKYNIDANEKTGEIINFNIAVSVE